MRSYGLVVVTVIAFSTAARAQDVDQPFFAAFKTFCADTGAKPDLVKAAVEAAPFATPHDPPGSSTTVPFPMTVASWDISWNGHKLTVTAGTTQTPYGPDKVRDAIACSVLSFTNEDESIAAIRRWVGVQPDTNFPSSGTTIYNYQENGSERTAIIGDAVDRSADVEGRAWQLTVGQRPEGATVQMMHWLAPTPRNSN